LDGIERVTAPGFLRYELTNSLLRAVRNNRIDDDAAARALRRFAALNIAESHDPNERITAAFELAYGMGISFYDALYVALAEELSYSVVTADVVLRERVEAFLPSTVVAIEDV
jgi:predicted nucleic acid-binding protein